jgi:DHA2 family multidrug resistance protein
MHDARSHSQTEKWIITFAVMMVAFIEILDMTIVSVAMPDMMGSLGIGSVHEITWVITSYIVASAICMPLTGFLVQRFGRKRLLIMNIIGFTLASMMCGLAQSLEQMVVFRILQGLCGAFLVPISQFILRDTFPPKEQPMAAAIWGMGIMAGPILGPTIGGYIIEYLNWRWVFYINLPICSLGLALTIQFIKETSARRRVPVDWIGSFLMAAGIGFLQIVLDKGEELYWFNSEWIILFSAISFYCFSVFFVRGWWLGKRNIINLHLFKNHNFAVGNLCIFVYCTTLLGSITTQPLMLQTLFHYPALSAGKIMCLRGVASIFTMYITGRSLNKFPIYWYLLGGLTFSLFSMYSFSQVSFTADMSSALFWPNIFQGIGIGLFFVPLSMLAMSTLEQKDFAEASGIYSFTRSLGNSVGVSIVGSLLSTYQRRSWQSLTDQLRPTNPHIGPWFVKAHQIGLHGKLLYAKLTQIVVEQTQFLAYMGIYRWCTLTLFAVLPFLYLFHYKAAKERMSASTIDAH